MRQDKNLPPSSRRLSGYGGTFQLPRRAISVYAQIIGPKARSTIKMALDTGATYTMIPPEKALVVGYKLPVSGKKMVKFFTASGIEYAPLISISSLKCMGTTLNNV